MKKIILFMVLASVSAPAIAQKAKKPSKGKEQVAEVATPVVDIQEREARVAQVQSRMMGPMHHSLIQWSGHWREEIKIWSTPNSKEPSISPAIRDGRMAAEGRFLTSMTVGQLGTAPFEAQSVLGYDNSKQKFVKTWFDNLGTSILVLEGTFDEKNNIVDFVGFTNDPVTRKPVKVHQIMKIIDPNTQILEVFMELTEGKEFKSMEIKSTRG